jgi:hypothetical protein
MTEGHIKGPSSKIEDENVVLTDNFLVKTVCNGSRSGLADDTKNVHSKDGAGIGVLCSQSLGVIEVGKDGDDGVSDVVAQVGLSGLLRLKEDHQHIKKWKKGQNLHVVGAHGGLALSSIIKQLFVVVRKS